MTYLDLKTLAPPTRKLKNNINKRVASNINYPAKWIVFAFRCAVVGWRRPLRPTAIAESSSQAQTRYIDTSSVGT